MKLSTIRFSFHLTFILFHFLVLSCIFIYYAHLITFVKPKTDTMKKMFYVLGFAVIIAFVIPANIFSQRTPGAIVYYVFDELVDGTTIKDVSGSDPVIDLVIQGEVAKLPDRNGIKITNSNNSFNNGLRSVAAPDGLAAVIQTTNQFTVEFWGLPPDTLQDDARVVSYSLDGGNRNFSLMLEYGRIEMRIRTDITGDNGYWEPYFMIYGEVPEYPSEPMHLVWTWSAGTEVVYYNGAAVGERDDRGSDISSWDNSYNLMIGVEDNNTEGRRQYIGDIYLVAIYELALSAEEVEANYDAGDIVHPAGIPESSHQDHLIDLFPNPVSDILTLRLVDNASGKTEVTLHDCLGKTISSETFTGSQYRLDMSSIPAGVYFISLSGSQGNIVRKVLKE